jgi:curved DNA-binding protein CbpA
MADPYATHEIQALARILDEFDYYALLGVPRGANGAVVREAYYAQSRRFHPDVNRHLDDATRRAAERISKRVTEAYSILRDARRRKLYDERLQGAPAATPAPGAPPAAIRMPLVEAQAEAGRRGTAQQWGQTPNGRRYFALASADLARGDRVAALRNLQMAVTFEPGNQHFQTKLAELKSTKR